MRINCNFTLDITPEDILTLAEGIEKLKEEQRKRTEDSIPPFPTPASSPESWAGKTVKIKIETPDSEIASWYPQLGRDVIYGVSDDDGIKIRIQNNWFKKIWFQEKVADGFVR